MRLGLTGSIATGKSTVAQMLVEKGALLVDADQISRDIVQPGSDVLNQIVRTFGNEVIYDDGTLNRKALGKIIFEHEQMKLALNQIMHPAIRAEMKRQMNEYETEKPGALIVVDVPLLFESKLAEWFEKVMLVYVPQTIQMKRLMQRDQISEEDAKKRIFSQMDIEQKRQLADIVIDNSISIEDTREQIDTFWLQKGIGSTA